MTVLALLGGVLVVVLITALTGYFVAQEFAFMTVDRSSLRAAAARGDLRAGAALDITRRTSFMLSGAQLGITVTGLVVGYVAEPLIGEGLGELLDVGWLPTAAAMAVGGVVAVLLSTVVQMVLGELFPKNLAIARPDGLARALAPSTRLYLAGAGWLVRIFDAASNALLRAVGIEPVHDVEHSATVRDLGHIVEESERIGTLDHELGLLLERVLEFPERRATHAMVPRSRVDTLPADLTVADALQRMAHGHSRYPVLSPDDEVTGVVELRDVVAVTDPSGPIGTYARPPLVVPEVVTLAAVLATLQAARRQLAVVIDEFGGFAGIVTAEDLAEEIVGDIDDEHDVVRARVVPSGDGWTLPGDLPLDETGRILGHELPGSDAETLGGLLMETHGGLLAAGAHVEVELPSRAAFDTPGRTVLRATVLDVAEHVPGQVRVVVTEEPEEPEAVEGTRPDG